MKQRFVLFLTVLSWQFMLAQSPLDLRTDFSVEEKSPSEAIILLTQQTGVEIAFSENFFSSQKTISLQIQKATVQEILSKILFHTNISHKVIDNQIVLFQKAPPPIRKFIISGFVKDEMNGEGLIAATVLNEKLEKGTLTNEYGFFSLTLPEGKTALSISYLGYEKLTSEINLTKDERIEFALKPSLTLAEIIVTPQISKTIVQAPFTNDIIPTYQSHLVPDLGGEEDVMRMAQMLPGVQGGADGLGGMIVRGGNVDQNLTLLDGVPIYNPSHMAGLFSVYNSSAIRSSKLIKGGFPARYGGRASSILDVRTREGNQKALSGEASIGLITAKGTIEGPFAKKKGAFLLTARSTHLSFFVNEFGKGIFGGQNEEDSFFDYFFFDLNAKLNYKLSENDRVFLSFYYGGDRSFLTHEEETEEFRDFLEIELGWGNTISALRWNHIFGARLFANTTLTFSEYQVHFRELGQFSEFENQPVDDFFYLEYSSKINDLSAKIEFDYIPSPNQYIRFGAGYNHRQFEPGATFFDEESTTFDIDTFNIDFFSEQSSFPHLTSNEWFAYFENEISLSRDFKINLGLRTTAFLGDEKNYAAFEPRISANYFLNDQWTIHSSLSRMVQYLHLATNTGLGLPNDVWLPSSKNIKPQSAWQAEIGSRYATPDWELNLSVYYKRMNNMLAFGDSLPLLNITIYEDLEDELISGKGESHGFEFLLKKQNSQLGGWLSYTLSWANRQYEELNKGNPFPSPLNRRHSVNLFLYYKLTSKISLSGNFVFGTATPLFLIYDENFRNEDNPIDAPLVNRENIYTKPYHRLDLSVHFDLPGKKVNHEIKIGAYNVYNQSNLAFHNLSFNDQGQKTIEPIFSLPIIPSFKYTLSF